MSSSFTRYIIFFSLVFIANIHPFLLFSEGVKQLNPDSTHSTALYIQAGSSLYSCFGHDTCDADHKLYVHIDHLGGKIYMGFSWSFIWFNHMNVILKINNSLVFGPVSITAGSAGYINYFRQAYTGPDILSSSGYNSIGYTPTEIGDYEIDFDIPGFPYFGLDKYDVTVVDTTITPLAATNGRLWAKLWALNDGYYYLPTSANIGTMYVYTDDMVVTSVFFNSMQGQRYEISCNANGCYPPPVPWDSSCRSILGTIFTLNIRYLLITLILFAIQPVPWGQLSRVQLQLHPHVTVLLPFISLLESLVRSKLFSR